MIKIRKAKLKDLDILVNLWKDFFKEHRTNIIKKNPRFKEFLILKRNTSKMVKGYYKYIIEGKNSTIHLAEEDGFAIAYNVIEIKQDIPIFVNDKFGYIADLYVKKQFRGKNISSKLYMAAVKWFKQKGVKHISIGVYSENTKAHMIYKQWGFFDYRIEMRNKVL